MSIKNTMALSVLAILSFACQDNDVLPKPKAYLALEYPEAQYFKTEVDCPFEFKINSSSTLNKYSRNRPCWLDITYPEMKGSIYISYYPIDNNLKSLIIDAQKLPLKHEIKADAILSQTYINDKHQTYGLFYEVEGNAASQAQFYLTDSLNHFVTGSIYFKAQPNYDSILPAAEYLKKDMRKIMESLNWKKD
ncbi:gliding motility lipoprotein GldD [Mesohalobacter salilacus]|uniref:gliding motility lipoprotein GldD n=1 Tax=Mesohalobacter salilacus TaxID=2491711 RepID=UPI00403E6F69